MGIAGLEKFMWKNRCTFPVSIERLVRESGRNVIVVDGKQFYALWVYPDFDWVCGGLRRLEADLRNFVGAFARARVRLEFFFTETPARALPPEAPVPSPNGDIDDWAEQLRGDRRFNLQVLAALPRLGLACQRPYGHTPMHVLPEVIHLLRDVLKCKVHLTHAGSRKWSVAARSREDDCLAVLAQDNLYIFYSSIPRYLSLKNFDLRRMRTVQYHREKVAELLCLEDLFYPILVEGAIDGGNDHRLKRILKEIYVDIKHCNSMEQIENVLDLYFMTKEFEECNIHSRKFDTGIKEKCIKFCSQVGKYNLLTPTKQMGPLNKWLFVIMRAKELYESGQMSNQIFHLLSKKIFVNPLILEDFKELPPTSIMYQKMRQKLYSIMFQEGPDDFHSDDASNQAIKHHEITEWCVTTTEVKSLKIGIEPVDSALHPGLLRLWDRNADIQDTKWKLFGLSISPRLNVKLLRALPEKLIVPTAICFYLYNEVPRQQLEFQGDYLQSWELDVFIAQAIEVTNNINLQRFSKQNFSEPNVRAVNLIAAFAYGASIVSLIIEASGSPIEKKDTFLSQYFDGNLFHLKYEKAKLTKDDLFKFSDKKIQNLFLKIKNVIL